MEVIKEHTGTFVLKQSIIILTFMIVLSASLSIFHVYHVLGAVREKTNEAVLSVATVNVLEFYGGARESDGFARHPEAGSFVYNITTDAVADQLAQAICATDISADNTLTVGDSYTVSNIDTQYVNASGAILHFQTSVTVTIPLQMGGVFFSSITKTMEVKSSYDTRF